MPKFRVRLVADATAWADVEVEAENEEAAVELACNERNRNQAKWELSEGNYLKRNDVSAELDEVELVE